MSRQYDTFLLSDEPKIAGIPITTGIPIFVLTTIGLMVGYAYQLFIVGALISGTMYYQFGGLPIRFFLATMYWSLPRQLTAWLFRAFPNSSYRVYIR